jgi:hypothetical protein
MKKLCTLIMHFAAVSTLCFCISSCSKGDQEKQTEQSTQTAEEARRQKFVGTWKITPDGDEPYQITLKEDSTAFSTYRAGEKGFWKLSGKKAHIKFTSGWQVIIFRHGKEYIKWGFAPGISIHGEPTNKQKAEKIK